MRRTITRTSIMLVLSTLALAACNRGGDSEADKLAAAAASAAATASAAADAAANPQAPANCPPTDGAENLLGVKIGMSEADAKTALACANANYQFAREEGEKEYDPVQLKSDDRVKFHTVALIADTGLDRVLVWLVGLKGAERVWGVDRRIEYTEDTRPVGDTLANGLTDKYGKLDYPTRWYSSGETGEDEGHDGPDKNLPRIVNSSDNQRLDTKSSLYSTCNSDANTPPADRIGNFDKSRRCGFVMTAQFTPSDSNPNMVKLFELAIRNSRDTAKLFDEDAAKLIAAKAQKQSEEAAAAAREAASANRNTPKL